MIFVSSFYNESFTVSGQPVKGALTDLVNGHSANFTDNSSHIIPIVIRLPIFMEHF